MQIFVLYEQKFKKRTVSKIVNGILQGCAFFEKEKRNKKGKEEKQKGNSEKDKCNNGPAQPQTGIICTSIKMS